MTDIARQELISQLQDNYKVEIPAALDQPKQSLDEFRMGALLGIAGEGVSVAIDTVSAVSETNKLKSAANAPGTPDK